VAIESGTLSAVVNDLFGFGRHEGSVLQAKNYGILPWWTRPDTKAALWRPFTALTHWTDYQLFPNAPVWMHAQNIAWFAAVVFLAGVIYRELMGVAWVAGFASILFLLDKDTYFPVMFVANRGFILSLCFGLLCLHQHHRWRFNGSRVAAWISALALAASVLANEAGSSTLAFLIAYALCLERPAAGRTPWNRAATLLPAFCVILVWRIIYQGLGFGVVNVGAYIDPAREPLRFLARMWERAISLLAGQLTGVAPDVVMALNPALQVTLLALGCVVVVAAAALFLPLLRSSGVARFWFVSMLLAAIPAATVVPLSKNLGFVAVAAFGLIAAFVSGLVTNQSWVPRSRQYRRVAWAAGLLLLLTHVPGAIAGRLAAIKTAPAAFNLIRQAGDIGDSPEIGDQDVVVVNAPSQLSMLLIPFDRVYRGQALPKSLRTLTPGCTGFELTRPDARTLVIQSRGPSIFYCGDLGPVHSAYIFARIDRFTRQHTFKPGDEVCLKGLVVRVLETDANGLPARVAFQFEQPLDAPGFRWLCFDWKTFRCRPFQIPPVGESVFLPGPRPATLELALRQMLGRSQSRKPL